MAAPASASGGGGDPGAWEVAVIGAGFAGCEVAWACARGGRRTLLATTSMDTVLAPATDPARIDPPEGTLLERLVDDLGASGSDEGGDVGAVRSADLHRAAKERLEHTAGLHLLQSDASALRVEGGESSGAAPRVAGFDTWEGVARAAPVVVLAVGSFLRARLESGALRERSGRLGEMAYDDLYDDLAARGFAFEAARGHGPTAAGPRGYRVAFVRFAPDELEAIPGAPAGAARLPRVAGLYAAGVVAGSSLGAPGGSEGYRAAAGAGAALGRHLAATRGAPVGER